MKKLFLIFLISCMAISIGAACSVSGLKDRVDLGVNPTVATESWDAFTPTISSGVKQAAGNFGMVGETVDVRFVDEPGLRFTLPFGKGSDVTSILPANATNISFGAILIPTENLNEEWQNTFVDGYTFSNTNHVVNAIYGDVFSTPANIREDSIVGFSTVLHLQERNYNKDISARAVIKYTEEGEEKYLYSDAYVTGNLYDYLFENYYSVGKYDAKGFVKRVVKTVEHHEVLQNEVRVKLRNDFGDYMTSGSVLNSPEGKVYDFTQNTISVISLSDSDVANNGAVSFLSEIFNAEKVAAYVGSPADSIYYRAYVNGQIITADYNTVLQQINSNLCNNTVKVVVSAQKTETTEEYQDFLVAEIKVEDYVSINVNTSVTYDGENVLSKIASKQGVELVYSVDEVVNAGSYTVDVSLADTSKKILNRQSTSVQTVDFVVNKKIVEVSVANQGLTNVYNGNEFNINQDAYVANGVCGNDDLGIRLTVDGKTTVTDAGVYTIEPSYSNDNYQVIWKYSGNSQNAEFVINKADLPEVIQAAQSFKPQVEYGATLNDVTLPNGFEWKSLTEEEISKKLTVGDNQFTIEYKSLNKNYNDYVNVVVVKVLPKKIDLPNLVTEFTYTGSPICVANTELFPSDIYEFSGVTTATDVNDNGFEFTVKIINNNYTWADGSSNKTVTWKILPKTIYTNNVEFNDIKVEYNGQEQKPVATNIPEGVSVEYSAGAINAGESKEVTAKLTTDSKNYTVNISELKATVTIEKRRVSAVWNGDVAYVYNGANTYAEYPISASVSLIGENKALQIEYSNNINVGVYTIFASLSTEDAKNYTLINVAYMYHVVPRPVTVKLSEQNNETYPNNFVYNTEKHNIFQTAYSVTQGNVVEGDNLKVKLTANGGSDVVDAGEYTITAVCLNSNYSVTFVNSGEKLLTIAKADSQLKPFELEAQYSYTGELLHNVIYNNQNPIENHVVVGEKSALDVQYSDDGENWNVEGKNYTQPGDYYIKLIHKETDNYKTSFITHEYKVMALDSVAFYLVENGGYTAANNIYTYKAADYVFQIGNADPIVTVSRYTVAKQGGSTINYVGVANVKLQDAGTYTLTAIVTHVGTASYSTTVTKTIEIEQLEITEPIPEYKTYKGTAYSNEDFFGESYATYYSVTWSTLDAYDSNAMDNGQPVNAGEYTATLSVTSNYKWGENVDGVVNVTIQKAPVDVTVSATANYNLPNTATFTYAYTGLVNGEGQDQIKGEFNGAKVNISAINNVGSYGNSALIVVADCGYNAHNEDNYYINSYKSGTLVIVAQKVARPEILAENYNAETSRYEFVYNGYNQTIVSYPEVGVTVTTIAEVSHAVSVDSALNVDNYKTTISLNNTSRDSQNNLYINYVWDNENQTHEMVEVYWSITKATLTITAKDVSVVYGSTFADNGYTVSGLLNDTETVIKGTANYTTNYQTTTHVGASGLYVKVSGLTADNYNINYIDGKVTVTVQSASELTAKTNVSYKGGKFENSDLLEGYNADEYIVTWSTLDEYDSNAMDNGQPVNAGEYTATISLSGDYVWSDGKEFHTVNVTIQKAPVDVTVSATANYNLPNTATFTYAYTGLVNGEGQDQIKGEFNGAKVNISAINNVGSYANSALIVVADCGYNAHNEDNYYINSYKSGTLVIVAQKVARPEILAENYNVETNRYEFVYNGYNQTIVSYPEVGVTVTTIAEVSHAVSVDSALNVDNYKTTISLNNTSRDSQNNLYINYVWDNENQTHEMVEVYWSITKATLTITANDVSVVYGSTFANNGYTVSGLLGNDTETVIKGTANYTTNYQTTTHVGASGLYVKVSGLTADNYNINYIDGTVTVTVQSASELTAKTNVSYKGGKFENSDLLEGYNADEYKVTWTAKEQEDSLAMVDGQPVNAGEYTATIELSDDYVWSDGKEFHTVNVTILKKQATVSIEKSLTRNYDENENVVLSESDYSYESDVTPTITWVGINGTIFSQTGKTGPKDVGEYKVTISLSEGSNYYETSASQEFEIFDTTAVGFIVDANGYVGKGSTTITYFGSDITVTINPEAHVTSISSWSIDDVVQSGTNLNDVKYTFKNVGSYKITVVIDTVNNLPYEGEKTISLTVVVNPAPITVKVLNQSTQYSGGDQFAVSNNTKYEITSGTLYPNDDLGISLSASGKDVDTYPITPNKTNANYNVTFVNENGEEENATFTITKAPLTVKANDVSIAYSSTFANNGYTVVSGLLGEDTADVVKGEAEYETNYTITTTVGTSGLYVKVSGLTADNYNITFVDGTVSVIQKEISEPEVIDTITYKFEEFNNGEIFKDFDANIYTNVTWSVDSTVENNNAQLKNGKPFNAGTYTATITLNTNYKWDNCDGVVTVVIKQKEATVTLNEPTVVYGSQTISYNTTLNGVITGDDLNFNPSYTINWNNFNWADDNTIKTTGFAFTANSNYSVTVSNLVDGELVVDVKQVDITVIVLNQSTQYSGGDQFAVSNNTKYEITSGTLYPNDDLGISLSASGKDVDTYQITPNWTNKNYNITWQYEGIQTYATFTITKAPLTVKANDVSIAYSSTFANKGYTVSGLLGEDTAGVVKGEAEYETNYTTTTDVVTTGLYVKVSGLTADNYNITFVSGAVSVTQKEISEPEVIDTITYKFEEFNNGEIFKDFDANIYTNVTWAAVANTNAKLGTNGKPFNAGTYTATITLNTNYKWDNCDGDVTVVIKQKNATVTLNNPTVVYGSQTINYDAEINGVINDDDLSFTPSYTIKWNNFNWADDNTIKTTGFAFTANSNYSVTVSNLVDGKLVVDVTKASLTVTISDQTSVTYNKDTSYTTPELSLMSIEGIFNDDSHGLSLAYSLTQGGTSVDSVKDAGTYYIVLVTTSLNSNYQIDSWNTTATFTINPFKVKKPTPTADINNLTYDGTTQDANDSVTHQYNKDESGLYPYYTVSGNTAKDFSKDGYKMTFTLNNPDSEVKNYVWIESDNTTSTDPVEIPWSIKQAPLTITVNKFSTVYTTEKHTYTVNTVKPVRVMGAEGLILNGDHKFINDKNNILYTISGQIYDVDISDAANYSNWDVLGVSFAISGDATDVGSYDLVIDESKLNINYSFEWVYQDTVIENYQFEDAYTITKMIITVATLPSSVEYGDEIDTLELNYTVRNSNGQDQSSAVSIGTIQIETNYSAGDAVNGNYTIKIIGGFTLNDTDNYELKYYPATKKLTVNKASATITIKNQTEKYNGVGQSLADINPDSNNYSVDGLKNSDNVNNLSISLMFETSDKLVDGLAKNVGTYYFTASSEADNYNVSILYENNEEKATFTITKATLTITAKNVSVVYGSTFADNGYTVSGLLGEDTADVVKGEAEYDTNYTTTTDVVTTGLYVKVSGLTADNYNITFVDGTVTVTKKEISEPEVIDIITYKYEEFNNGEIFKDFDANIYTNVTWAAVANTNAKLGTNGKPFNAGTYTATITLNTNYKWATNCDGDVTVVIKQKNATVTLNNPTVVYGSQTISYNTTPNGVITGDSLNFTPSYTIDWTDFDWADDNTITTNGFEFTANSNYSVTVSNLDDSELVVDVTQAPLTVKVFNQSTTYNSESQSVKQASSYTENKNAFDTNSNKIFELVSGTLYNNDDLSGLGISLSASGTDVKDGGYKVTLDWTNKNYNITWQYEGTQTYATFTINPKPIAKPEYNDTYIVTYAGAGEYSIDYDSVVSFGGPSDSVTITGHTFTLNNVNDISPSGYNLTYALKSSNYIWTDKTDDPVVFTWYIQAKIVLLKNGSPVQKQDVYSLPYSSYQNGFIAWGGAESVVTKNGYTVALVGGDKLDDDGTNVGFAFETWDGNHMDAAAGFASTYSKDYQATLTTGSTYITKLIATSPAYVVDDCINTFVIKYQTVYAYKNSSAILSGSSTKYFTIEDAILDTDHDGITTIFTTTAEPNYVQTSFTGWTGLYGAGGNYTLSKGIYLPYNSAAPKNIERPNTFLDGVKPVDASGCVQTVLYIPSKVSLTITGKLAVGAEILNPPGGHKGSGIAFDRGVLWNDGTITVGYGGTLTSYGNTKGKGIVIAEDGATLIDVMCIYDFKGGSQCTAHYDSGKGVFPFNAYTFHNISCKTVIKYGATYQLGFNIYMNEQRFSNSVVVIGKYGTDCMFAIGESGYIIKSVGGNLGDTTNTGGIQTVIGCNQALQQADMIQIYGTCYDKSVTISLGGVNLSTGTFQLPISRMNIEVYGNLTMSEVDYKLLPGSSVTIMEGATCTLSSDIVVYSLDQFKKHETSATNIVLPYINSSGESLYPGYFILNSDATLCVNGRLIVDGGTIGGKITTQGSTGEFKSSSTSTNVKCITNVKWSVVGEFVDNTIALSLPGVENVSSNKQYYADEGVWSTDPTSASSTAKTYEIIYNLGAPLGNPINNVNNKTSFTVGTTAITLQSVQSDNEFDVFDSWLDINGNSVTSITDTNCSALSYGNKIYLYASWKSAEVTLNLYVSEKETVSHTINIVDGANIADINSEIISKNLQDSGRALRWYADSAMETTAYAQISYLLTQDVLFAAYRGTKVISVYGKNLDIATRIDVYGNETEFVIEGENVAIPLIGFNTGDSDANDYICIWMVDGDILNYYLADETYTASSSITIRAEKYYNLKSTDTSYDANARGKNLYINGAVNTNLTTISGVEKLIVGADTTGLIKTNMGKKQQTSEKGTCGTDYYVQPIYKGVFDRSTFAYINVADSNDINAGIFSNSTCSMCVINGVIYDSTSDSENPDDGKYFPQDYTSRVSGKDDPHGIVSSLLLKNDKGGGDGAMFIFVLALLFAFIILALIAAKKLRALKPAFAIEESEKKERKPATSFSKKRFATVISIILCVALTLSIIKVNAATAEDVSDNPPPYSIYKEV